MNLKRNISGILILTIVLATWLFSSCSDDTLKHYNLGVDYAEKGDLDLAVKNWELVLKERPDDTETNYNLGIAMLELERFSKAEFYLKEAAKTGNSDPEIHAALGQALEAQDRISEAKKSYNMAIALRKNFFTPYLGLASCALRQKQYKTAEKYSTIALNISTRDLRGNLILAEAYYEQGNYTEAYAQLLSIRYTYPTDKDLLMLLGKVMVARHMYEDALETLHFAGENGRSDGELYTYLGYACFELKDFSKAEKYFQLAIFKDKNDSRPLIGIANTYMKTGNYEKALEYWDRAYMLDPDDTDIPLGMSIVYINTSRFEDGVKLLEKLIKKEDFPARALYYLGHTRMRMGQKEKARESFEEFIRIWQGDRALIEEIKEILITL
ncbi:MAG: tetratricopeptide repeat protein [Candidatus Krumholzibacteriota bacterium]|nr:tetratricopeptide repeat protein [Candidatus Krumholzibacteriota bacterium]